MSQSGNGHSKKVKADDLTVFEPAFAPGDEDTEKIGYFQTDTKGEEGKFVQELPQEITGEPSTPLEDKDEKDGEPDS